jgi:branched-chain amino acid transport system substrate-binding protein
VWAKANGSPQPTEEGLAGFTAAWALFHDVLPSAASPDDSVSIATAARAVDLPEGSLPNGSGLRFATDPVRLGQNELAAAVVWQWQPPIAAATAAGASSSAAATATPQSVTVWPAQFASGSIDPALVPLPR